MAISPLQKARTDFRPSLPTILKDLIELESHQAKISQKNPQDLNGIFPKTWNKPFLEFKKGKKTFHKALRLGVVLSGGQAPGGHNVIAGIFDALKILNNESQLFGFINGPSGIIKNQTVEITEELLFPFRNQGGFDLIGSGRTKIETPEQFKATAETVKALNLDGLVIIGGDDSNTNAALLAEYFQASNIDCSVIGVPKTIDGDLKNEQIEVSFGFDTACKIYSEIIGNIMRDALSAKKYYYFIKLMGRSASHVALECALQTHPNMTLIGEEIQEQGKTLNDLVVEMCELICQRSKQGKDYGVILIPEGIVEFIPEVKQLINELNGLLGEGRQHQKKLDSFSAKEEGIDYIMKYLSTPSVQCFRSFPREIQLQLLLDRDPHGNVQVSKIETERLFMELVNEKLKTLNKQGIYSGKFSGQPLFCGYEGRSGMPTNFDCQYCYTLGYVAALLVSQGVTGYMACVKNIARPINDWEILGVPLVSMMHIERRLGKEKPVIKKALVEVSGKPFSEFKKLRQQWMLQDDYSYPGPIQFFGPKELTEATVYTIQLEARQ